MSAGTGFGITPQGFVMPQLTDIKGEIEQTLKSSFGADVNLDPQAFFGQIVGIFSERESLVWQAMQDVYNSQNPDEAFGASLDNVGSLRGIPRDNAVASSVQNVRLFGSAGTVIPITSQFSVQNAPTSLFSPISQVTLVAGQSCVQRIAFSAVPASGTWQIDLGGTETDLLPFNATAADVQVAIRRLQFASGCTVTGNYSLGFTITFAGAGTGGFMVQQQFVIVENSLLTGGSAAITITPSTTTPGIDQGNVQMVATETGPIVANSGTLTVIATPVTGLTAVLNTQDASIGSDVESDNAYRVRMSQELQSAGAGTVEAILAKLKQVSGVTAVLVFENETDIDDILGRPPHSFECVVQGGDSSTIANTIWQAKPAGIETDGNVSVDIVDSQGQTHTIRFSRPTAVPVYIIANITIDDSYPAGGDAAVASALVAYGDSLGIGKELIVVPKLISQIANIQGIQDAVLLVGIAPGPTLSDNITPSSFEVLEFDTSRVQVNHV